MGALIATHHSSRRMNKTLLLVVSAIALATAVQPDVSVPADAFTEAAQLVQSMQKQGQDDNACLQLAKDFEDEVKTNVAALQEAQGNLDTGADCDNAGQSGVTAAKKVRDDAADAVANAQKAFNAANTAAVTIGTFAFNTLKPGNCGMFFSTSAYTSAESTQKASKQALDQATGALATAEKGVTAAIAQAKKDVQDCKCKVYNNHKDTLTKANSDAEKANKAGWTKAAHLKCVLEGTSASDCTVPSIPKVKAVTLCDGCDASACHGECVQNCLNDSCGGWRLLKTCGLGNVALSAAKSWQGTSHFKCPEGWYVPHSTTYFNYMAKNGCKSNNPKSSTHGHTYYNQCGWSSYTFAGKSRSMFAFTDSLTGNKRYQHAGNYPGYAGNTGFNTNAFAGWVCMREGTQ